MPHPKLLLASLLVAAWAAAMALAFWWFEARYIRPFDTRETLLSGAELRLPAELAGPGPIRVVHFWDPACPCNVGNQQHLAELLARFSGPDVSFHVVCKPGTSGRLPDSLVALRPLANLAGAERLPASPAIGIWDRAGRLAYFGPYSDGVICSSNNSFVEPILEALIAGRPVQATQTLAVGCFCRWAPGE